MSVSTPGVVERASKEISRRIHSLGFKTSSSSKSPSSSRKAATEESTKLSESDRLNGNDPEPVLATVKSRPTPPPKPSSIFNRYGGQNDDSSSGSSGYSQARTMGSIIKGSVMDKVTHVFSVSSSNNMGNTNTKPEQSISENSATPSNPPSSGTNGSSKLNEDNAINIPKGIVSFVYEIVIILQRTIS